MSNEIECSTTSGDIVRYLEESIKYSDMSDLLDALQFLYQSTGDYTYRQELEDMCRLHGYCPICFSKLQMLGEVDQILEYQGFPSMLLNRYYKCPECGKTID